MYNPYLNTTKQMLEPVRERKGLMEGLVTKLRRLDEDDLLLMLIVYLVVRNGDRDDVWPLLAALVYCILS